MPAIYQNFSKGLVQTSLGSVDPRETTTTKQYELGTELIKKDQKWRYCKNGAVQLAPGKLVQASAPVANHVDRSPAADVAIGSKTVDVSIGATAATANQYAGGFLQVIDGAGEGYLYRVASHPAHAGSGDLTVTLEEGIKVALVAAGPNSKVSLIANPWSGALVAATGLTAHLLGAATQTIPIGQYFWAQVGGPCAVLADGVLTVGNLVVRSNNAAGAVETSADATDLQELVGVAIQSAADGEYGAVHLTLE